MDRAIKHNFISFIINSDNELINVAFKNKVFFKKISFIDLFYPQLKASFEKEYKTIDESNFNIFSKINFTREIIVKKNMTLILLNGYYKKNNESLNVFISLKIHKNSIIIENKNYSTPIKYWGLTFLGVLDPDTKILYDKNALINKKYKFLNPDEGLDLFNNNYFLQIRTTLNQVKIENDSLNIFPSIFTSSRDVIKKWQIKYNNKNYNSILLNFSSEKKILNNKKGIHHKITNFLKNIFRVKKY